MTVGNIALSAQDCINNLGSFTNTATGEIRADRAFANGIWNETNGTFRNDGKIFIGTVANTGAAGILIDGISFVNSAGAEIQIDRVRRGLTNRRNFTNAGQIRMGNNVALSERGVLNGNGAGTSAAVFINQAGGLIQIDRTAAGQDGLTNEAMTTFTNLGTVTIGTSGSIGGNGISNAGTVSNSACATLTVAAPINNGNSFLNAGLFTVSTTRPHSNTGSLTNNGLISYPQGNPIPNVVNNKVIAAPISSCSNTITPALQLGGNSSQFSVGTTWYTDPALTQSAGTYNQGSNTFTATNLGPGSGTTLYVAATDNANGCTKTVSVSVTLNAPVTASISPTNPTLTCASPTVSLTASGGSSYVWDDNSTNAVRTVSSSDTYSVTVSNGAGCSAVANVSVGQDNTAPVASLVSSGTLSCAVTSVTLTASPDGLRYIFSAGATQINSSHQAVVSSAGVYSVTAVSSNGCSATASTTVQSNTATVTIINPTVSTATVGAVFSQTFTASGGTSPYSYSLASGSLPSGLSLATTGVPSGTPSQAGSFTLTVNATDATGCSGVSIPYVLTVVNATPTVTGLAASPAAVCVGSPVTFTATIGNLTASYSYTLTNGSSTQTGSSASPAFSQSITASGTGIQTFTLTVSANGQSASGETTLTVNPLPSPPTLTGVSRTVNASNTPLPLGQFVSAPGALSFSGVSGAIANPPTASISTGGVQNFSVTQTDATGCTSGATPFGLTVLPPTPGNQTVCRSSLVVLTAFTTGVRYEWYKNGQSTPFRLTEIASIQRGTATSSLTIVSVQTTASYYVKIFQANGSFSFEGPFVVTVNYGCTAPGARVPAHAVAVPEVAEVPLSIRVTPNPVVSGALRAVVTGAAGQALTVELMDLRGRVVRQQTWPVADAEQLVEWDIAEQPVEVYLLRAVSQPASGITQSQTLKIIKSN